MQTSYLPLLTSELVKSRDPLTPIYALNEKVKKLPTTITKENFRQFCEVASLAGIRAREGVLSSVYSLRTVNRDFLTAQHVHTQEDDDFV